MPKRRWVPVLLFIGLAIVAWLLVRPSPSSRVGSPAPRTEPAPKPQATPEPASESPPASSPGPDLARLKRSNPGSEEETPGKFMVRGFVTNVQGAALTGAKVSLAAGCEGAAALVSASTDTIGFYQLRFEDTGGDLVKACLRVQRSGYNPVAEWIESQPDWQKRDYSLTPAAATLRGRVTDPRGRAVADAVVQVVFRPEYSVYREVESNVYETRSDVEGRYRFKDLPLGEVGVSSSKEGYQSDGLRIELASDEDGWLDFRLLPVHEFRLSVVESNGDPVDSPCVATPGGRVFCAFEPGVVDFRLATDENASPIPCRVSARRHLAVSLDFDPLHPVHQVVLKPAAPLRGRIVDQRGVPVAGALASLLVPYRGQAYPDPPTRTDQSGGFELYPSNWPPLYIRVSHERFAQIDHQFPPEPGDFIELTLKRPDTGVRGRFVDALGKPYPFFAVTVSAPAIPRDRHLSFENRDGSFQVMGLAEGRYQITFHGFTEDHLETAVVKDLQIAEGRVLGPIVAQGTPVDRR